MKIMSVAIVLIGSVIGVFNDSEAATPYIKPLSFEPLRFDTVTLDASFTERFFMPGSAISNASFEVAFPNGKNQSVESVTNLKTRNVLEQRLTQDGTYRFSTGRRLGPVFRRYSLNGESHSVRGNATPLPEGAELTAEFRPLTSAVAYVTKKAPSATVLELTNEGLELKLDKHPNNLFNQENVAFTVYFDGQPLPNQAVTIYQASDQYSEESDYLAIETNSRGRAEFTPQAASLYLMKTRYRTDAPAEADVPQYSYTTTLTLEIY
tara:strand:+ start:1329 stop:2123 length:795 start_codon:yes stop_codon:yes gene_type:complete